MAVVRQNAAASKTGGHTRAFVNQGAATGLTARDPIRNATITAEPLETGFGMTLGNALRRVLLSSLQGAAVTAIQIDGIVLKKDTAGPVTAGDIEETADVEILNPDHVICTLDEGANVRMELTVSTGKGYVAAADNRPEDAPIGLISIDALYSPVKRVAYRVENTREGQVLDYDKLIIDLETNGAVTPEDAIAVAARILQDQFQVFVNFDDPESAKRDDDKPELDFFTLAT